MNSGTHLKTSNRNRIIDGTSMVAPNLTIQNRAAVIYERHRDRSLFNPVPATQAIIRTAVPIKFLPRASR